MKTLLEVLQHAAAYLAAHGLDSPSREAEMLLADCFNMTRMQLYLEADRPLQAEELDLFNERLRRRGNKEPGPYIHGSVDFYGLKLKVTPAVLIPRPETEILVDKVAKVLAGQDLKGKVLLDLCTGSGCMGLALKKRFNDLTVFLSDISEEALSVAKENGRNLEVRYFQGDLFVPFVSQTFHYIVCNPPYVSESEYLALSPEVRDFEPKKALLAGKSGLEFYERLQKELPLHLKGQAWFEIGANQGPAVVNLFQTIGKVCLEKDWAGHDRFISLEIE